MNFFKKLFSSKQNIRLYMTLLVRNEEEVLETHIRFHHAMGVDGFIVTSHSSTDSTNEILKRLQAEGIVKEILYRDDPGYPQDSFVSAMINIAKHKYHADWVINADADEFYYSDKLNLKESIKESQGANILWVDSIFSFPSYEQDFLKNTFFVTRPFQAFEAEMLNIKEDPSFCTYIGSQGCTKVIHKTHGFRRIKMGNHDAKMRFSVKCHSASIRLYHYHIRSYKGMEDKVKRWEKNVFRLPEGAGLHMKHMVNLYQEGRLRDEFERRYGKQVRQLLIDQGVITNDPSVYNFLVYKKLV